MPIQYYYTLTYLLHTTYSPPYHGNREILPEDDPTYTSEKSAVRHSDPGGAAVQASRDTLS